MDKYHALYQFFSGFGLPAYTGRAPKAAIYPFITYETAASHTAATTVRLDASLWYRGDNAGAVDAKTDEIAAAMTPEGVKLRVDGGYIRLWKAPTFAELMGDPDDDAVRRMVLHFDARFLTAT